MRKLLLLGAVVIGTALFGVTEKAEAGHYSHRSSYGHHYSPSYTHFGPGGHHSYYSGYGHHRSYGHHHSYGHSRYYVPAVTAAIMATTAEASTTGAVGSQSGSTSKNHQNAGLALLGGKPWQRDRYFGRIVIACLGGVSESADGEKHDLYFESAYSDGTVAVRATASIPSFLIPNKT